jgi:hypothetical protein
MNNFASSLKARVVSMTLLGFLSIVCANQGLAQCPTATPVWTHASLPLTVTVSCPSGPCYITVDYCYRYRPSWPTPGTNTYETVAVGDVTLAGSCDCDELDMFEELRIGLLKTGGSYAPPCGPGYEKLVMWTRLPYCYKKISATVFRPCSTEDFCVKKCDACYSGGVVTLSNCTYITEGSPNCSAPPSDWSAQDDHCYGICGSNP